MPTVTEEHDAFVSAVRTSLRRQVAGAVERRSTPSSSGTQRCPRCGDDIIILDQPMTFALEAGTPICKACRGERDLAAIAFPDADMGGEGG